MAQAPVLSPQERERRRALDWQRAINRLRVASVLVDTVEALFRSSPDEAGLRRLLRARVAEAQARVAVKVTAVRILLQLDE